MVEYIKKLNSGCFVAFFRSVTPSSGWSRVYIYSEVLKNSSIISEEFLFARGAHTSNKKERGTKKCDSAAAESSAC